MKTKVMKTLGLAVTLTLLSGLLVFASPVSAGDGAVPQHSSWTTEISGMWVWNQCTGEWIVCDGIAHYTLHLVTDSSGGYHWLFRGSHNLSGLGSYGNKYQVISNFSQHLNSSDAGLPYEWVFVNTSPLISHGKDTNMIFCIRNKVTINAVGETTVSYSYVWVECQGNS
jgi:hypothetical protein